MEMIKGCVLGTDCWRNFTADELGGDIESLRHAAIEQAPRMGGMLRALVCMSGKITVVDFGPGEVGDPEFPNVPEPRERPMNVGDGDDEVAEEVFEALKGKWLYMLSIIGEENETETFLKKESMAKWVGFGDRLPGGAELKQKAEEEEEKAESLLYEYHWSAMIAEGGRPDLVGDQRRCEPAHELAEKAADAILRANLFRLLIALTVKGIEYDPLFPDPDI